MKSLNDVTPSRDHRVHLLLDAVGQVRDDHVEAVVDRGLALGLLHPGLPGLAQRLALVLDREVDDRRRAAVRRGDRARLEVVGRRRAAERHVEVRVDVDAARAGRTCRSRRSCGRPRRVERSSRSAAIFSSSIEDVAPVEVGRGDDRAVLDQRCFTAALDLRHRPVGLGPAVAVELPDAPDLLDHVEVHLGHDELVLVLGRRRARKLPRGSTK